MPSLPARGAWIEISVALKNWLTMQSLPARGAWIEILYAVNHREPARSLPARGAWIEIRKDNAVSQLIMVAPRKGSVD